MNQMRFLNPMMNNNMNNMNMNNMNKNNMNMNNMNMNNMNMNNMNMNNMNMNNMNMNSMNINAMNNMNGLAMNAMMYAFMNNMMNSFKTNLAQQNNENKTRSNNVESNELSIVFQRNKVDAAKNFKITIYCKDNEKLYDITERYLHKVLEKRKNVLFLYNASTLDETKTPKELGLIMNSTIFAVDTELMVGGII